MSIYAKLILILTLFSFQLASIAISKNIYNKSLRTFIKYFLLLIVVIGILSPKEFIDQIAVIIGVGRGPDALLYLLIIIFVSVMHITFTKFAEIEDKLNKIVQDSALVNKKEIL